MSNNINVEQYLSVQTKFKEELTLLVNIARQLQLKEDYKWMHPCYKHNNKNIILIHEFKEYCAILFIKGSLLKDPEKILVSQTKDVSDARQIRFTNKKDINKQIIIQYIKEAILIEDSGIKTPKKELILIQELKDTFNEIKGLEEAFNNLTPGRQRGYNIYFSNAKQSKTRLSRIKNNIDKIMSGQGLKD